MHQPQRRGAILSSLVPLALSLGLTACGAPEASEPTPTTAHQQALDVVTVPLELAPLALTGALFYDRATQTWTTITKQNGTFTWPTPYDLIPPHIHFAFAPAGSFTSTEIEKLANQDGYELEVSLNDVKLTRASGGVEHDYYTTVSSGSDFGCPAGLKCLTISVPGARALAAPLRWDLKVSFWKTPTRVPAVATVHGYVKAPAQHLSYFLDKVAPIFQHRNCSTCHSLGSKAKLVTQHQGMLSADYISTTATGHGTQYRCGSGCHVGIVSNVVSGVAFTETEWMVPGDDMDINWSQKTAPQICARVKQNLTSVAQMETHFFQDARIAWAVHSGALPGNRPPRPKAPPGDYFAFVDLMRAWIEGGQPCP